MTYQMNFARGRSRTMDESDKEGDSSCNLMVDKRMFVGSTEEDLQIAKISLDQDKLGRRSSTASTMESMSQYHYLLYIIHHTLNICI